MYKLVFLNTNCANILEVTIFLTLFCSNFKLDFLTFNKIDFNVIVQKVHTNYVTYCIGFKKKQQKMDRQHRDKTMVIIINIDVDVKLKTN